MVRRFIGMVVAVLLLAGVLPVMAQDDAPKGIIDTLAATDGVGMFTDALTRLDLVSRYNNTDVFYTVFAPDDAAFTKLLSDLGYESLDDLTDTDKLTLSVVLTYHFVGGVLDHQALDAVQKDVDGPVRLSTALPGAAIIYENGKLDERVNITTYDIAAGNGVIHVLDGYLVPTQDVFNQAFDILTANAELMENKASELSLADNLRGAKEFSMLAKAMETAGLMDDLEVKGPYTLFALTDDSFKAALDTLGTSFDDFLKDEDELTAFLTYLVLPGQVTSGALRTMDGMAAGTMLPYTLVALSVDGEKVTVNTVPVTLTDIVASNGIIHVLGGMLLPPPSK